VVPGLNVGDVEGIAAGSEHAMVLGTDGSVWGWGDGTYGDLGDNSTYAEPRPVLAIGPGSGIIQLAAGAGHTVALLSNGTVEAWGDNQDGELGGGFTSLESLTPVTVTGLSGVCHHGLGRITYARWMPRQAEACGCRPGPARAAAMELLRER
jgi:alpha-tubulin suppressor-like RCC1 family protein